MGGGDAAPELRRDVWVAFWPGVGRPKSFLEDMLAWHGFGLSVYFGCLEGSRERRRPGPLGAAGLAGKNLL